jgi:hypothetical protein
MRSDAIFAVFVIVLSYPSAASTEQYRTYVAPTSTETMKSPCEYELTLRDASKPVKAVFVVIERGWQVGNLYFDPEVTAFAERHDLALVLARHCRSKTEEDMDIIPEHGVGRALAEPQSICATVTSSRTSREQDHPVQLFRWWFDGGADGSLRS